MSAPLLGQHLGDPAAVLSNAVGTGLCSCLGLSSPALCYSLPSRRFLFCPIRFLTDAWRCGCAAVSRASPDSVANGRPRRLVLLPVPDVQPGALAPPDGVAAQRPSDRARRSMAPTRQGKTCRGAWRKR